MIDKIFVTFVGTLIIGFIYWFFFGKKNEAYESNDGEVNVIVEGGYKPSVIKLRKGVKTTISLFRKDPNTCLEDFILPDFKISKFLPINKKVEIEITPTKSGEFPFHCGMNMFHGKVVIE